MTEQTVTLVMPARSEYLILARLALAGIARSVPIGEEVLSDLKLAVTEACGNAVAHAYRETAGTVEIRYVVDDGSIAIEVRDEGDREPPELPSGMPEVEDGLPPESGMGLAIVQAIVDELEIEAVDDVGTVVRMRKRLSGP